MRLLAVDDDDVTLEMLHQVLAQTGHEVQTAHNGLEAMRILRQQQCRIVVTDWRMPEMDGLELCRAIRAEPFRGYVYIILLTSNDSKSCVVDGLGAGADDFMSKPFHADELIARLNTGVRIVSLETRDLAIFAMAKLVESRDPETGSHLERVRRFSQMLAQGLARNPKYAGVVTPAFVHLMYQTSPLHDIGKVSIPDHVLLKPGQLDDREFEIMKTHAWQGAVTLDSALQEYPDVGFLRMARDITAYHHERWDGAGYPTGRSGDAIPLSARIFALADVYDALTSKRVYKGAFAHDIAKSIILKEAGRQFDPDVVAVFLDQEDSFGDMVRTQVFAPEPAPA